MNEINEEIKLTLNIMQTDIDDGAHGELQKHLNGLLEIKRNELQQRLVERSWFEPADSIGRVVSFDQEPYKSVKLEGQLADEAKPLTTEELKAGKLSCADASEDCRLALVDKGISVWCGVWHSGRFMYCVMPGSIAFRSDELSGGLKQIHRIGNEFYWGQK